MNYMGYGVSVYRFACYVDTYYFNSFKEARCFARSRSRAYGIMAVVYDCYCDKSIACYSDGYSVDVPHDI